MTASPPLSFEAIAYQFRKRCIVIASLPAEYSVNYLDGKADTAETRETLNEAIELPRPWRDRHGQPPRGQRRPIVQSVASA
jgi:hypothetical protein